MELRKHERISVSVLIDVYELGSVIAKGRGHVSDISIGGLSLDTHVALDIGTMLFLKIGDFPIEIKGKVIRIQQGVGVNRYGVKFIDLGFFDKRKLKKHIEAYFKK
ncbi:MAG: PilZ domain-containing protein [Elusimicrobiota bacterium]